MIQNSRAKAKWEGQGKRMDCLSLISCYGLMGAIGIIGQSS